MQKKEEHSSWEAHIEEAIRKAQQEGKFDDLAGKGKPIALTPNPFALEQELAFKILQDAGFAPEWIEIDKSIRQRLDRARRKLMGSRSRAQQQLDELAGKSDSYSLAERERVSQSWRRATAVFAMEIAEVNEDIADLNLKVPSPRFQRPKINAARVVARIEAQQA